MRSTPHDAMSFSTPLLPAALVLVLSYSHAAGAPKSDSRTAIRGSAGWGQLWNDEGRVGGGGSLAAGLEIRLSERLGFRLEVSRHAHHRDFDSGVRFRGQGMIASGNLVRQFEGARARPFLFGGLAFIKSEWTSRYPILDARSVSDPPFAPPSVVAENVVESSDNRWGVVFGGGVEIPLGGSLGFVTEGSYVLGGALEVQRLAASMGFSYHW